MRKYKDYLDVDMAPKMGRKVKDCLPAADLSSAIPFMGDGLTFRLQDDE